MFSAKSSELVKTVDDVVASDDSSVGRPETMDNVQSTGNNPQRTSGSFLTSFLIKTDKNRKF